MASIQIEQFFKKQLNYLKEKNENDMPRCKKELEKILREHLEYYKHIGVSFYNLQDYRRNQHSRLFEPLV